MDTTTQTPTAADYYADPYPGRNGNDRIYETCGKCVGEGSVSWGIDVDGQVGNRRIPKVCFDCGGTGQYTFKVSSARSKARRHARKAAEAEAAAAAKLAEIQAARDEFTSNHPEVVEVLPTLPGNFGESLRTQFETTGKLTENQVAAALRIATEQANAPEDAPVVEGRVVVTGKVLTLRDEDTEWGITWKMLVQDDRGFKVWGTAPRQIVDEVAKGDRVTFTATVTASDRDETFGFAKRPAKAEIL